MKVYLIGPDDADYSVPAYQLVQAGHEVSYATPPSSLRISIAVLTTYEAVCLVDGWWTSSEAHMLQTIAAWLRLKVVDASGVSLPTTSLRG